MKIYVKFETPTSCQTRSGFSSCPAVSTRKKELIGDFKNAGAWRKVAEPVLVHDWPQDAIGQAIPYSVYEVSAN